MDGRRKASVRASGTENKRSKLDEKADAAVPPTTKNDVEPVLVIFSHPGIERDAFTRTAPRCKKGKGDSSNYVDNPLSLEVLLDDGQTWRGKGSVFGMPRGDQRYLIQTKALVVSRDLKQPQPKLVRFAGEYSGFAEEICRSGSPLASALSAPWTRVMRPLLSSSFPLEAMIRDNDPFVLTAGAFRYGLCKQFSLSKMRTLPVGSIILFASMSREKCYLDTVFVVGKAVDVIDENAWQQSKKRAKDAKECSPADHCILSHEDLSCHQGAKAWDHAMMQCNESLVDKPTKETIMNLAVDFRRRNPTPSRLAQPPRKGTGPLSGRLYWGKEYNNDGTPFSFVPVWEVEKGQEHGTADEFMRPRPELNLRRLHKVIGAKPPTPNAQLVSIPITIASTNAPNAVFDAVREQVEEQGYDLGVRFAPPEAMDPEVERQLLDLELDHIKLCESSFGAKDPIKRGTLLCLEGSSEVWKVVSLHMGPFIRVKSQTSGEVRDWPSIGLPAALKSKKVQR